MNYDKGNIPGPIAAIIVIVVALLTAWLLGGAATVATNSGTFGEGVRWTMEHTTDPVTKATKPETWCVTVAGDPWDCAPIPGR